jgi:hypothetical protein
MVIAKSNISMLSSSAACRSDAHHTLTAAIKVEMLLHSGGSLARGAGEAGLPSILVARACRIATVPPRRCTTIDRQIRDRAHPIGCRAGSSQGAVAHSFAAAEELSLSMFGRV